jgi:hypothetical protein
MSGKACNGTLRWYARSWKCTAGQSWICLALVGTVLLGTFFSNPAGTGRSGRAFPALFPGGDGGHRGLRQGLWLFAVALSARLSVLLRASGSCAICDAAGVTKKELYAVLAGGRLLGLPHSRRADRGQRKTKALERSDQNKSILLRELAHGLASKFASVAGLIGIRSADVSASNAKSVLDDAIEQVTVMARVHRRPARRGARRPARQPKLYARAVR